MTSWDADAQHSRAFAKLSAFTAISIGSSVVVSMHLLDSLLRLSVLPGLPAFIIGHTHGSVAGALRMLSNGVILVCVKPFL